MKTYIVISYDGSPLNAGNLSQIGLVIKKLNSNIENIHGTMMTEDEVNATIIKQAKPTILDNFVEESACIYAQRRFAKYFNNSLKLTLAVSEAAINSPTDEALLQAIKVIAKGVSSKLKSQYGITNDVVLVFKQIANNLRDV